MTATPPPSDSTSPSDAAHVRQQNPDSNRLNDQNLDPQLKAVALRIYLDRSIAQNEQSAVTTAVSVYDLQNNRLLEDHAADSEQFAASINKLPVARLILQDLRSGKLQFDQEINWSATDIRAGAGTYDQPGAPLHATVKELLFDMLNPSGNTALRVLVNNALGGASSVNNRFKTELALQHTFLQPVSDSGFYLGNTTSREALQNIVSLLEGDDQYQQFVKQALATNIYTDYGVRTQLAGNDYITLVNKVGILDDPDGNNRHDVGVVYNARTNKMYAYAFMNTAHGASYNLATSQAGVSLADMGRGVLRYSGDKQTSTEKALRDSAPFIEKRMQF
jgi:beta-lactamase class A